MPGPVWPVLGRYVLVQSEGRQDGGEKQGREREREDGRLTQVRCGTLVSIIGRGVGWHGRRGVGTGQARPGKVAFSN